MKYHIKLEDGTTVASFEEESDRDMCIDVFEQEYSDYIFIAVNGE